MRSGVSSYRYRIRIIKARMNSATGDTHAFNTSTIVSIINTIHSLI